jgi:tRNA (cytidine/uridine-2'-O-)-methyltransferase
LNHLVLFQPEIPQNTGNIMRTAMATGSFLHIIGPLTFSINDKTLKRTGLDYIEQLQWKYYPSYEAFDVENNYPLLHCITRYGDISYTEPYQKVAEEDVYILFGSESSGLPNQIMKMHQQRLRRIPMIATARSLNVSNAVAIVIYELLRQQDFHGLSTKEVIKGEDFLKEKLR